MFITINPHSYNWLEQMFSDLFDALSRQETQPTQKAQARREGYHEGLIKGMAAALVAVGTEQRIAKVKETLGTLPVEGVQMLDLFQVRDWIIAEANNFRKGERQHLEDGWDAYISGIFAELVWPASLAESYEGERHQLILDGKLEPDARDAEWLNEHYKSMEPTMSKIKDLITTAEKKGK